VLFLTPLQFAHLFCNLSRCVLLFCTEQVKLKDTCSYLKMVFGKERLTRWTASGYYFKRPEYRVGDHLSGRPSTLTNWWRNLHSKFLGAFRSMINSKRDGGQRSNIRGIVIHDFLSRILLWGLPLQNPFPDSSHLRKQETDWTYSQAFCYKLTWMETSVIIGYIAEHWLGSNPCRTTLIMRIGKIFFKIYFCVQTLLEEESFYPDFLISHCCASGPWQL